MESLSVGETIFVEMTDQKVGKRTVGSPVGRFRNPPQSNADRDVYVKNIGPEFVQGQIIKVVITERNSDHSVAVPSPRAPKQVNLYQEKGTKTVINEEEGWNKRKKEIRRNTAKKSQ